MARQKMDSGNSTGTSGAGLQRSLSGFAHLAITYSIIGPTVGVAVTFGLGLTAGPAFIWGFLLVGLCILTLCLNWAELASHFPHAAAIYSWPSSLGGKVVGWFTGWLYMWFLIILGFGYFYFAAYVSVQLFEINASHNQTLLLALAFIFFAAVLNASGTKVLGRVSEFAVIAEWTVIFVIGTALLIGGRHHGLGYLFDGGDATSFGDWLKSLFGLGIVPALAVMYAFEAGGTLGEDTLDAKRRAPRGILAAFGVTLVLSLYLVAALILAVPDLGAAVADPNIVFTIISTELSTGWNQLFLGLLLWISVAGGSATFMAAARQVFGMVRDGQLPGLSALAKVRNGTPWAAILAVMLVSSLTLFIAETIQTLALGIAGMIYIIYIVVLAVSLAARLRGWPKERAPFSLGRRGGLIINVVALIIALLFFYLLASKTDSTNPPWKLGIPVIYWLAGLPLLVGVVYYSVVRTRIADWKPGVQEDNMPDALTPAV